MKTLSDAVVDVLTKWGQPNEDFDAMWYGYDYLLDEVMQMGLTPTMRELKKEVKSLGKSGKAQMLPIYDDEYRLSGRGWFLC